MTQQLNPDAGRQSASPLELKTFLESAILAPSPDNNQPWRFEILPDGGLRLDHDLARALPSDVLFMFSMIALGAALENLCIAARQHAWEPEVKLLLSETLAGGRQPIAVIHFHPGGHPDPLYPFLAQRVTCRKPYSRRPPPDSELDTLARAAGDVELRVHWVTERPGIRALAPLIASTDRLRFEYQSFHEELYRQLRFSAAEAERTRDGLDLRTLEVPPGTGMILRLLRSWKLTRTLNRLGLSRMLSLPSALAVWRSGAIGSITVADTAAASFLQGGRGFERLWLTAQQHGLALQPLGSLPIFLGHLEWLGGRHLNASHRQQVAALAERFRRIIPASRGRALLLLFRLGYAGAPQVRSLRRPVASVLDANPAQG
jgi:nitroreductase